MHRGGQVAQGLCAVVVVVMLAGCLAATPTATPDATGTTNALDSATEPTGATSVRSTAQQAFDRTTFEVRLLENGSARWTFVYRRALSNQSEREQFRSFAERFGTEETELYTDFQERARLLTEQGATETGRSMSATGFSREAEIGGLDGNQGIVRMSFVWEGFAVVEGDRVIMGDVFDGGLYTGPDQRLVVTWREPLSLVSTTPEPDASNVEATASPSITWEGEQQFTDGRPQVVLTTASETTTTTTDDGGVGGGDGSDGGDEPDSGDGELPMWLVLTGVLVLVGIVGAAAYRTGAVGGAGGALGSAETPDDGGGTGQGASADPDPAVADEELLTDEDRVLNMLEENGGRMKQVNIVEESGWSKSKVSMLLSEMEEEEVISKLRVGRENIISMKGSEPEGARSPFDRED